jgi:radical SAM protein with 4Fe4S-binding SPASM domain
VIYANKRCNFSCDFCFTGEDLNKPNANEFNLTKDQLIEMLDTDHGKRSLRVGILGGEPFLNKNIFELLNILYQRRKVSTVVTNSSQLKGDKLERLISTPVSAIGLSLYDNNVEDVKRVASRLTEAKKNYWIQWIVSTQNLGSMESIIRFAISVGCKNLQLSNYYPLSKRDESLVIHDDDLNYLKEESRLKEKYSDLISISWVPLIKRKRAKKSCKMPFSFFYVDNKGSLGACCFQSPNNEKFGNIFDAEVWNSAYYKSLRKNLLSDEESFDACKYCETLHEDLYGV